MPQIDMDRRQLLSVAAATALGSQTSNASASNSPPEPGPSRRVEDFGAIGDGRADDSHAFNRALASALPGSTLELAGGRRYRLTKSLVFQKPLIIKGGTKENTRLLFDDGAYASLGGQRAAMIFPHEASGIGGTARRSCLSGITLEWAGSRNMALHGMLISTPVYLYETDVLGFPRDGFHIEAQTTEIRGNANGSSFINCSARNNGRNGFTFLGNDANACILIGSRAFDNLGAGFYDGSLLGNTYIAGEVDGNQRGGYTSDKALPNRSTYLGCYAEPNQWYDLNNRNLLIAPLGHCNGATGAMLRALPSGELFAQKAQIFAREEASGVTEKADRLRIDLHGIDLSHADGQRIRLTKLLSDNYVDILNGNLPVIRFPSHAVAGNVDSSRPWLPQGITLGAAGKSGIVGSGTAPPKAGTFQAGALWLNEAPAPGAAVGWACVASGTPGIWHSFGEIAPKPAN